jgi:hypothetical protein
VTEDQGPVDDSYGHGDKALGCIKSWLLLYWLHKRQPLAQDSA